MSKIGIFIPCYNVEDSIQKVIDDLLTQDVSRIEEIVIVDNKSADRTCDVVQRIQQNSSVKAKITLIKNEVNYGLGGSQKIAYQYFLDHGFSHFMIIHGDNQADNAQLVKDFFNAYDNNPQADVIMASRFTKESDTSNYSVLRMMGNVLFNWLTAILTGLNMSDSGCGIMMVRTEVLKQFPFWHLTNSFQFNPQLNILYHSSLNIRIIEIPLIWSDSDEGSNISAIKYCLVLLKILLRYRFNKSILRKKGWELFDHISQQFTPQIKILN